MRSYYLPFAALMAVTLTLPAGAQVSPTLQDATASTMPALQDYRGPIIPHMPAAPVVNSDRAENPGVTSSAKNVYGQLAAGDLNRSKLTSEINGLLTPSVEQSLSTRLRQLGSPGWTFLQNADAYSGPVSIYRLKYAAGSDYLTFGVDDNGIVYAFFLANRPPRTK